MAFKIEFILEQHTPILHFQANQSGAGLRATELKPKLDRYIWQKWIKEEGNDPDKAFEKYKQFLVGFGGDPNQMKKLKNEFEKGKLALNYKLSIISNKATKENIRLPNARLNERRREWSNSFPNFFANMGIKDKNDLKEFSFFKTHYLRVQSFFPSIIETISTSLPIFLLTHNFGTRQSKGFGGFYLHPNDNTYVNPEEIMPLRYHFTSADFSYQFSSFKKMFTDIEYLYKFMRSGINLLDRNRNPIFYLKSALFKFMNNQNLKWDKRWIKENLLYRNRDIANQQANWNGEDESFDQRNNGEAYLVRDLLGLSSQQKWLSYNTDVEKKHETIERFQSPIFFKPLINHEEGNFVVYFDYNNIHPDMLNTEFTIKAGHNDDNLRTPPTNIFSMHEFFNFLFKSDENGNYQFYPEDLLGIDQQNLFPIIDDIFNQIRQNYNA